MQTLTNFPFRLFTDLAAGGRERYINWGRKNINAKKLNVSKYI